MASREADPAAATASVTLAQLAFRVFLMVAPLGVLIAVLAGGVALASIAHGRPVEIDQLRPLGWLAVWTVAGLAGSFTVHEVGHLLVLRSCPGVRQVALSTSLWRISLIPAGVMSTREVAGAALAGPGLCVALGAILATVAPEFGLHWFYVLHGIFILPVFGDGRALLSAASHALSAARQADPPARRADP